ncbi:zinc-ribbon domain-containing protein [Streptomyces iakyrus]|uniref:zinc-ribbon domain-containing protein n=1 Tax=Streptomyces iakyrus TaxID=68219 RepID=UPI0036D01D54
MRAHTLLKNTHQEAFAEALGVVDRPMHPLSELGTSSSLKVQWRCAKCGHCWVATPAARSRGTGCPQCAVAARGASRARAPQGQSLSDLFPELRAEFVRNETRPGCTPEQLRPGSQQRCWWRCSKCGYEWATAVSNRTAGRGCPGCANKRRAEGRRRVTSGSAADRAPWLESQLVVNLTSPGVSLRERRPASLDRCGWKCPKCGHEWEATIVNRVTKCSGCPKCAVIRNAEKRRIPHPGHSLSEVHPQLAAQLVANETHPGRMASDLPAQAADRCRWRCSRGHEWTTTVSARTQGSGCPRCGGFGRSRFELEVAELLKVGCAMQVDVDVTVVVDGRRWRIDLHIPGIDLYLDLDPAWWHSDHARDSRKAAALSSLYYLRVRPEELGEVGGRVCVVVGDRDGANPVRWSDAIGRWLRAHEVPWDTPTEAEVSQALVRAARAWNDIAVDRPLTSAMDVAPHLAEEFVENLTRPGIGLEWVTAHAPDRVRWKCKVCGWVWDAVISSRAGARSGCPKCVTKRLGRERSIAPYEQSLAALDADLAGEFVSCIPHPERTPAHLRPSSNFRCAWRCRACGHKWEASPAGRARGRGCPVCARERIRLSHTIAPAEVSLLAMHSDLAGEFLVCVDEPGRSPNDLLPKSNKRCRWSCAMCGYEWLAQIATRTAGYGCPQCGRSRTAQARASAPPGGSLADLFPQLAAEAVENVDRPERDPRSLRPGSHNRCRWCCSHCGHTWITSVKNRARNGTRCPACVKAAK